MPFPDLTSLDDHDLADIAREREVAWQAALGEIDRRRTDREWPAWSEQMASAAIARKRADSSYHPRPGESYPIDLPPLLFRIGYEWAYLTLIALLEKVLARPSQDIVILSDMEPAGRGLWREKKGSEKAFDPRRRAALDLIETIERYANHSRLLTVRPPRRATYTPADDQALLKSAEMTSMQT